MSDGTRAEGTGADDGVEDQLVECYGRIVTLGESMSDEEWSTQSLCPDWDSRGVVLHLVAVEKALVGWRPEGADDPLPFDGIADNLTELGALDSGSLIEATRAIFDERRTELADLTPQEWKQPSPTPVGPADYRDFMKVRVFDFWIHERDIATPLGRTTDDGTAAASTSLDQVHGSLGYIVGKRIGLPDGMSIVYDISGQVSRRMSVVVDGRAKITDDVADPDVTVSADLLTFMQLACGRIDPDEAINSGWISWSGDDTWGRRAASSLRFTM